MPPDSAITVDDIQLGSDAFWARPLEERDQAFATLRAQCPVSFHPELNVLEGAPVGPGFWSITRYDDLRSVNRRPGIFGSASGITLKEPPPEILECFGSLRGLAYPRH